MTGLRARFHRHMLRSGYASQMQTVRGEAAALGRDRGPEWPADLSAQDLITRIDCALDLNRILLRVDPKRSMDLGADAAWLVFVRDEATGWTGGDGSAGVREPRQPRPSPPSLASDPDAE